LIFFTSDSLLSNTSQQNKTTRPQKRIVYPFPENNHGVFFKSIPVRFGTKCVSPTFAMPHRGMASLASVGLDVKPWLSASLAWLNTHPASASREDEGLRRVTLVPIPINFRESEIGAILVTLKEGSERQG
jgi:hypothetical protein